MKTLSSLFFLFLLGTATALAGQVVDYQVNGQTYEGYYSSPADNAPLVVMIHDWDGLTDYEIKRTEMLNELGYAVFAADMFGKGVRPTAVEDKRKMTGSLYKDRAKMRSLLDGAVAAATSVGGNTSNAVTIGYCFGGAVTLEHARSGANMKGFVSFHGGLTTPEGQDYSQTKGTVLVLHGTADAAVSMDDFAKLAVEMEQAKIKHEMITYSGAPHAFTVFGSERYRKDADEKSWARFVQYLNATLK
ncbi:Dienelactone hydrolase [Malonomonas rubra DSM 5091]|uniref:Dienelactone hydrolase n=1 Tax=Malonomonas rubra DSM 5091 TaxID=1122189 RepID=A0A1M6N3A0_MALRU|nr:dienelactone hydrolase family protein [Malonomonas rubra]SHJ90167.1 Dienelactone hydrolase [Malonomonas rubra DSM 5091]